MQLHHYGNWTQIMIPYSGLGNFRPQYTYLKGHIDSEEFDKLPTALGCVSYLVNGKILINYIKVPGLGWTIEPL